MNLGTAANSIILIYLTSFDLNEEIRFTTIKELGFLYF